MQLWQTAPSQAPLCRDSRTGVFHHAVESGSDSRAGAVRMPFRRLRGYNAPVDKDSGRRPVAGAVAATPSQRGDLNGDMTGHMNRRELLAGLAALGLTAIPLKAAAGGASVNILWRNGWAILNIGDIGHVPGALALLRHYIPEAAITLWAQHDLVFRGSSAERARFPDGVIDAGSVSRKVYPELQVVRGTVDEAGRGDNPELDAAIASADIMVIGSGAGVLQPLDLLRFHTRTKKPVGLFGVTTDSFNFTSFREGEASNDVKALRAASFVFTRERTSLRLLDGEDVDGPGGDLADNPRTTVNEAINRVPIGLDFGGVNKAFVPDTTFAFTARDEAAADRFMGAHALEEGKFVCFVPRHRWTPTGTPTRQGDSRDVYNAYYLGEDHDKLKVAITTYIRKTGHKVALVPETVYMTGKLGPLMRDGLPADVAGRVAVMEGYWMPDAAQSVYARAQAVVSIENHSPILAAAAGTPFVMVHQPEDSFKGDMFIDIGLGDWYIRDINTASGEDIARVLIGIVDDMPAARAKLGKAMEFVRERHRVGMLEVRRTLGLGPPEAAGYPERIYR